MFVAIINFFMAMSLNSFLSTDSFMPALFLYFISNLATFLEKIYVYDKAEARYERAISYICFSICLFLVCGYLTYALHFMNLNFQKNNEVYRILIQGIPDSFFTFSSIDVTGIVLICVWVMPAASFLLVLIPWLRDKGFSGKIIWSIVKQNKGKCISILIGSFLLGFTGVLFCYLKSYYAKDTLGSPQYLKYYLFTTLFSMILLFSILLFSNRMKKEA